AAPEGSGIELRRAPFCDRIVADAVHPLHDHHSAKSRLLLLDQGSLDHLAGNRRGPANADDRERSPVSNGALQVLAMLTDFSPLLLAIFAFGAVAPAVFVIGQFVAIQIRLQKRIGVPRQDTRAASSLASSFDSLVSTFFDEKRFGVEGSVRAQLRRELMR